LARGDVLAVVVDGFTHPDTCEQLSERLILDHRLGGYATADGAASIKKIGIPLFEVAGSDAAKREEYYAAALRTIRALRSISRPRTATLGGEVQLWRLMPDQAEYDRLRLAGSYGLDHTKLPPPDTVVTPARGELVLFNSNRVHAVRPCEGGPRVTVSCFIG